MSPENSIEENLVTRRDLLIGGTATVAAVALPWALTGAVAGEFDIPHQLQRRKTHDDNYDQRWHTDLLQGLGNWPANRFFTRLAADRGRLGRADAVLRAARLSSQ